MIMSPVMHLIYISGRPGCSQGSKNGGTLGEFVQPCPREHRQVDYQPWALAGTSQD